MAGFVPLGKQSKKAQKQAARLKRTLWTTDPRTRVVESKKLYDRKKIAHDRSSDCGMSFFNERTGEGYPPCSSEKSSRSCRTASPKGEGKKHKAPT